MKRTSGSRSSSELTKSIPSSTRDANFGKKRIFSSFDLKIRLFLDILFAMHHTKAGLYYRKSFSNEKGR
jgi:hypothetical protein